MDNLTDLQRELLAKLIQEQVTQRYSSEFRVITTLGRGWFIQMRGKDNSQSKQIDGFTVTDLHNLKNEGYITLSLQKHGYIAALTSKALQEYESLNKLKLTSRSRMTMDWKILLLAANPVDTLHTRLDQEVRDIEHGIERSKNREQFQLKAKLAPRLVDVRRSLLEFEPNIIHFCGHGSAADGIYFGDTTGHASSVDATALAKFFGLFSNHVECVLLNACHTVAQAEAIAEHINFVIGIKGDIIDHVATEFAIAFYDGLGAGRTIEFAFELASNAVRLTNPTGNASPILIRKKTSMADVMQSHVLIVDDDDTVRGRLSHLLQGSGFRVVEATTNEQALGFLFNSRFVFTLIITDALRRPERYGESGYVGLELIKTINARLPSIPVILLSKDSPTQLLRHAPDIRIDAVLDKQLSDIELITKIREATSRSFGR